MKRYTKWLCGLLAVVLVIGAVFPASADNSVSALDSAGEIYTEEVDYFPYYDAYVSTPFASESIVLPATDAELVEGATLENGHMGKDTSVCLANGAMSWTIQVPTTARYIIKLTYIGEEQNVRDSSICLSIDGEVPFDEANDIVLTRIWKDGSEIKQDSMGNDTIPDQVQVMEWNTMALQDFAIFTNDPLVFWLSAGEHTITVRNWSSEKLHIERAELTVPEKIPTDAEAKAAYDANGYQQVQGYFKKIQAETPVLKSTQSIYATYDKSNPATEPYDAYNIRRNTIGDANWAEPGSWVTYVVDDVPADGLYYISLKYRQHQVTGTSTFRTIYVNGEVPSESYRNIAFPYNINWQRRTVSDASGNAIPVYLKAGQKNEIKLQATVGKWSEVLRIVEASNQRLNDMYIQIVMITGTTPDKYFDYNLQKEIPDLISTFTNERNILQAQADEYDRLNGGKSTQSETLRGAVTQLDSMLEDPASIPQRIANFRDTISTLSTWIYDNMNQSLELDYLMVHSADAELPKADASFWAKLKHFFVTFFLSFVMDYDTVGTTGGEGAITVWVTSGRDQASIMMDMITEDFTAETGIQVNISLVQTGFIEATLAGTGPDVAVGVSRGQPVNLACRGALIDLSKFDGYEEVTKRFSPTATVPYQYNGGTYAIPNTQSYFMMFYREDILQKLGLEIPDSWTELLQMVPILQKNHMEVGLPYSLISAAAAVDLGMAAKDIFPVLLLQNGGDVYNADGTASTLDSEAGMAAFKQWCEYYQQYGFELVYDFYTRFRNGDMPIGIADLGMYNTLIAGAPELRDKWSMAPIPGTVKEDGTVDRSVGSTGSGVVMFKTERTTGKNAQAHQEKCWKFIEWWTRADVQQTYNQQIENVMGPAGRNATANLEAFDMLPWKDDEKAALSVQRQWVKDLREVPGSYFVSRCIDNAFRAVYYDSENAREVFEKEVEGINREITRKRKELGLE